MKYSNKHNIVCFSRDELLRLFEVAKKEDLRSEVARRGLSLDRLGSQPELMEEIAGEVGEQGAQDRDEHEIFAALFMFLDFYKPGSEPCFEVKGFDPKKNEIKTLADLIRFRHGVNTSDFCILSEDGMRKFELKRYRGEIEATQLAEFIKEKVLHYSNDLGETNLLVVLQPAPFTKTDLDFHHVHEMLKLMNWKFPGEIRVSYNRNNEESVMIQVYPALTKSTIPIRSRT